MTHLTKVTPSQRKYILAKHRPYVRGPYTVKKLAALTGLSCWVVARVLREGME